MLAGKFPHSLFSLYSFSNIYCTVVAKQFKHFIFLLITSLMHNDLIYCTLSYQISKLKKSSERTSVIQAWRTLMVFLVSCCPQVSRKQESEGNLINKKNSENAMDLRQANIHFSIDHVKQWKMSINPESHIPICSFSSPQGTIHSLKSWIFSLRIKQVIVWTSAEREDELQTHKTILLTCYLISTRRTPQQSLYPRHYLFIFKASIAKFWVGGWHTFETGNRLSHCLLRQFFEQHHLLDCKNNCKVSFKCGPLNRTDSNFVVCIHNEWTQVNLDFLTV